MAMASKTASSDDSDARLSGKAVVQSMYTDYLKVTPYDWQVIAVFFLALERRDVLAVQPTGAGKSLVVHGAVAIENGVVLHVVPLLAIGADQTQDARAFHAHANSSAECYHLDGLGLEDQKHLQEYLKGIQSRAGHNILLICSPLLLLKPSWVLVLDRLWTLGIISYGCLDEMQKALTVEDYRPDCLQHTFLAVDLFLSMWYCIDSPFVDCAYSCFFVCR